MMHIEYLHFCDYAFVHDGKPCLIGVFEFIKTSEVPASQRQMFAAAALQGAPHEAIRAGRIEVVLPNGEPLARLDFAPDLRTAEDGGAFITVGFYGLTFPEYGRYAVKVIVADRVLSTTSLLVQPLHRDAAPIQTH